MSAEVAIVLSARDNASSVLGGITGKIDGLGHAGQRAGGVLQSALGTALGFAGATVGLAAVGGAFGFIKDAAIGMNAKLETTTLQFETLMGDADGARAHVKDLFEFAKATPFETGPIIEASRMLRTFGGAALDTKGNLGLIGDAAAATAAPINELGFWVGRMYSSVQAGKPFGEAAQRLNELAVLSPKARAEMEALQARGASSSEIWKVLEKDMGRFSGAMGKQAGTWSGLMSTLTDTLQLTASGAFAPFFEMAKGGVSSLIGLLSSDAIQGGATRLASGMQTAAGVVGDLFGIITGRAPEAGGALRDAFGDAAGEKIAGFTGILREAKDLIVGAFQGISFEADGLDEQWVNLFGSSMPKPLYDLVNLATKTLTGFIEVIRTALSGDLGGALRLGMTTFEGWKHGIVQIITNALPDVLAGLNRWGRAAVSWITDIALPGIRTELPNYLAGLLSFVTGSVDKVVDALLGFGREFFAWVPKAVPPLLTELLGLLSTLITWVGDHAEEIGGKLVEWGLKFGEFIFGTAIPTLLRELPGILLTIGKWVLTDAIPGVIRIFLGLGKGIVGGILDGLGELKTEVGNTIGSAIRGAIEAIDFWVGPFHVSGRSGVTFSMPAFSLPNPFAGATGGGGAAFGGAQASGGDYVVTRPTWFLAGEAGIERATFRPLRRAAQGTGGDLQPIVTQLVVDSRVIAEMVGEYQLRRADALGGSLQ